MLQISKELQLATRMSEQEIRRELAVHLYTLGKLSIGKASELAEMAIAEFQCLLGSRHVGVNYGVDDFLDDLDAIDGSIRRSNNLPDSSNGIPCLESLPRF